MAYSPLPSKIAGNTINLANWDNLRDNFAAGVPDLFTMRGDLAAATGADVATRLGAGDDDSTLVADSVAGSGLAWQIQPAARVYNDTNIDPTPLAWVTLTFNSEVYDTDAVHSVVSNTSRLTAPLGGAGLYDIGANVKFDTSGETGQGVLGIRIVLNPSNVIAEKMQNVNTGAAVDHQMSISCDYKLNATDYVELQVYTAKNVDVMADGHRSPAFWMHWFRRKWEL